MYGRLGCGYITAVTPAVMEGQVDAAGEEEGSWRGLACACDTAPMLPQQTNKRREGQ